MLPQVVKSSSTSAQLSTRGRRRYPDNIETGIMFPVTWVMSALLALGLPRRAHAARWLRTLLPACASVTHPCASSPPSPLSLPY